MKSTMKSQVDVARLMQRVNAEVAKRSSSEYVSPGSSAGGFSLAVPDALIASSKETAAAIDAQPPQLVSLTLPAWDIPAEESIVYQNADGRFALKDILSHQDREFIFVAYLAVLDRVPDEGGVETYMRLLRSGTSKIEILGFLRESPEGRTVGAKIKGLATRLFVAMVQRWPIIGIVARLFDAIASRDELARQQRILDGFVFSQLEHMQNTARSSQAVVNCALRDLEAGYRELAMYSASKPGYEAVAHVESSAQFIGRAVNALQLLVDQKANGNEVRQMFDDVRNSILMVERGKADEREMSRINAKLDDARNAVNLLSTSKVDLDVLYGVRHDLIKTLETKAERREVSEEILAVRDAATHGIADLRESKAERSTVDHALDVLKRALGPKAERHELTDLTNYLVSLVQCRITREEVVALDQSIRDAIQVLSEVKADRAAVDATNDKLQSAVTSVRSATMASVDEMLGPLKGSIELLAHLKIDRVALDSALAETKAVTESAVNALSQSINALADTKADRTTLDNALGDAKAVTDSAVNTLTQSIRTLIDAKADRMTLDAVHNEFLDAQRRLEEALDTMAQLKLDRPMLDSALAQTNSATESALSALHQSIGALMTGKADSAAFDAKHGEIREGLRRLEGTLDALALSKIDGPMLEGVLAKSAATTETALHALAQSLKALVDGKVDLSTFDATSERVQAALDEVRADTTRNMDAALQSLRGALDSLAKTKSDRDALDAIKADGKAALDDALARVNSQTRDIKRNVLDQERRIALLLEEARKRLPKPISPRQIKEMLREEDHLMDAMYARFEDIFRGTREDIKHRQEIYLPYMKAAKAGSPSAPIIDVGCGRGEWLEVLRDAGLNGRGADLNRVFLAGCRDLGLDVSELDGVAYLRSLSPNSVGAVTSFHLVEHLDQKTMIALFDAAFHVLQPGGIAIFETPNPRNLQVGSCSFYLDPTHRHPLPPELLQYLLEARGFVDIQLTELHPPSPEKRVTTGSTMVNETLNRFFFSAQDYAVIGRKA